MNRIKTSLVVLACSVAIASPVSAQTPDDGKGRYAMTPADGGFLRLDKESGDVAMCARKGTEWVCDAVQDRTKDTTDIAKVERENKELRERIRALENKQSGSGGIDSVPPLETPENKIQLPTEEEVDQALDYVERIFKKFKDRVQKYESPIPPADTEDKPEKAL
ncbi:MAG: hypothetical protein CTY31_00580 [Hyphomicrobium sp.]|nr:MAG: hypothetical protein CTY39_04020 [Hyphomicrobium sp.]PPD01323.1 MAG: hypothetical protein CTY31_00580 [Hyphomicrobium sp.]